MFKKPLALLVSSAVCLMMAGAVQAQTVTGEVTDESKRIPFQGAVVRIEGVQSSTSTDERGRFRLSNVPPGDYTLVISYVGTADTRVPISVTSDGLAMGSVVIGATAEAAATVEEVLIVGQAAAVAGAINQERAADNLVSVLDADAMGQFPDQNVAESLNRLPGVTVENDQGEGRYVVIRGMDPDLNSTSINGVRASTGEPRRALQLDVIPSDVLDGLEVSKTLTPDMDGDAIGGSINIKTLSAFSRNGPYAKGRVEAGYTDLAEEVNPKLSIAGSNIWELANDRRLGIAGAISYNDRSILVNNNEADDWEEADNGADFNESFEPRLYRVDRQRSSAVLNFDLDATENTTLHLYTLYSKFKDTELRDALAYGIEDIDEDTATDSYTDYYTAELEHSTKDRTQTADNMSLSLGSETQLTDWLFKTNLGYSAAKEHTPNEVDSVWVAEFESGDDYITDGSPVLSLDRSNPKIPLVRSAFFSALQDASLFELDEIETLDETNKDDQTSLNLDAIRDTSFGEIQFGAKARWRTKQTDENVTFWSNDADYVMSDVPYPGGASDYGFPNQIDPIPNPVGVRAILNSGDGLEFEELDSIIDSNVADFKYDEDIYAAYGMGKWETDQMTFVAGVRVERTETDNRGNLVEIFEEGDEYNGEELEDDIAVVTPISAKKSYTDWLPSANLKFDFSETLVGRASVYKSVVRPRVEEVAYRVSVEDGEAELGNPDLDPFVSWNYDASISWYPTELSVISAGVFYKDIDDFIFLQELEDYEFQGEILDQAVIALNGDSAQVTGFEFNYQQYLGFLGDAWDGFLVGFNYTFVDSDANTGDRKITLPKQSENIGSLMLGYEKHGFDLRFAMKYRDSYIDELVEEGLDRYTDAHLQMDITAKYRFNDAWQVYLEVVNLNDESEYYYAGRKSRAYQYDEIGTGYALGLQWNFQ
ncbi:MAG TPA: TonB-dependent receptor [Xanthomonadales bacterium]|nr:TonB-dependent receptor [Xanthomonadales bacterium]